MYLTFMTDGLWPNYNDGSWPACCSKSDFDIDKVPDFHIHLQSFQLNVISVWIICLSILAISFTCFYFPVDCILDRSTWKVLAILKLQFFITMQSWKRIVLGTWGGYEFQISFCFLFDYKHIVQAWWCFLLMFLSCMIWLDVHGQWGNVIYLKLAFTVD